MSSIVSVAVASSMAQSSIVSSGGWSSGTSMSDGRTAAGGGGVSMLVGREDLRAVQKDSCHRMTGGSSIWAVRGGSSGHPVSRSSSRTS